MSPELAPARSPWLGLSAVCVGSFMATLDGSIVNLALPALHDQFHVGITSVEWVVTAYLLAVSASLLALGRLGDLWGHRRVFVGGLFGFAIGSALCAGSSSLGELVAARVLQGLGASAMVALGAAIITDLFPREMRGRALGVISSVVAAGLTAGPPLGGFLLQHLSWHWIFLVNVPVGLFGAIWALRILPERRQPLAGGFDLAGALWSALAMSALLGALDLAARGHARAIGLFFLGTALAAGVLFAQREQRAAEPLVDPGLFRSRLFSAGIVATLLSYTAMFASTLLTPFYLAQVRHLPASTMGLVLTAVPVGVAGVGPAAGYLSDRIGSRGLCVSGMVALAVGLGGLAELGARDPLWTVVVRLGLCGLGMGLFQSPNSSAVMGTLPRARLGIGAGVLASARNLGMLLGIAVAGALHGLRAGPSAAGHAFLAGYALALGVAAAVATLSAVVSLVRA